MSLFWSILIIAPATIVLCVLIIKGAAKVFDVWPDVTKEERWKVNAKKGAVILAALVLLSLAVDMGTLGAIWLHGAL
ncbi:MAG: hypothetical protein II841_08700 [Bacteroidales bacterium]|nr:hypothetical protein [Bacteroidales bacterium]